MGEEDRNQSHKFLEIREKGDGDRISVLPDCVLLEILSRLPSTKYAIRTGTLSKRWEHLWTLVPTLIFRHTDHCLKNTDFALSVDKSLTQCRQLKLKEFIVYTKYDIRFESQYNNWILFAASCNVEKLNLDFEYWEANFRLDQSVFFINSCFTDLRLRGFILNPSGEIIWKNLKSLCIWSQDLNEDMIVNMLSGCPLLETLVLTDDDFCRHYISLDSDSKSKSNSDDEIEAPNRLPLLNQWPQLKKLKKLELCSYDIDFESQVNRWIHYAIRCNVKEIKITYRPRGSKSEFKIDQILFTSSCFNELILIRCKIDPVGAISWKNLRSLHISRGCLNEVLIENIISGSPVLETLELTNCFGYRRLDITSKSIKNLVLSGYTMNYDNSDIEINAPHILSLTIQCHLTTSNILLVNVSSLVKANLDYSASPPLWHCIKRIREQVEQEILKKVILYLSHVKEVKIGFSCSEVLSCMQDKGFIVPSNVKFPHMT